MSINVGGGELKELKPRILVVGVGGAGGNAINAMIVVQYFSGNTPLLTAAGNRNRCRTRALAQLGRHRAHTADRCGNHHHIALADFGLLNHTGPGGEPGHT